MFQLELVDTASGARRSVPIASGPVSVGSAVDCDLVLPGDGVAAHQCRVEPIESGLRLVHVAGDHEPDTLLNGRPVGRASLRPGDVVRLGTYQLTVVPAAAPPPPPEPEPEPELVASPPRATRPVARGGRGRAEARPPVRRAQSGTPGAVIGAVVLAALVIGGFLLLRGGGGDGGAAEKALRGKLAQARTSSDALQFDDALRLVSEVAGATASDRDLAELRRDALDLEERIKTRRERYVRGKGELESLRKRVTSDTTGATVGEVDRFLERYGDIEPLREPMLAMQDDLTARLAKIRNPDVDMEGITLPIDRTVADCVRDSQKWLGQNEFAKAHFVMSSVEPKTDDEKKQKQDQLAKIEAGAREVGLEILRRVDEHLELGHVLQALGEFEDDNLRSLRGTEIWYDLLEKADEVEDAVDEKIPEHARPIPRRKHARKRPSAEPAQKPEGKPDEKPKSSRAAPPARVPGPGPGQNAAAAVQDVEGDAASWNPLAAIDEGRALIARGDLAAARALLERTLAGVATPELAAVIERELERARRPLELAERVRELLAARPPATPPEVRLQDGRRGRLTGVDAAGFVLETGGAATHVSAEELALRSLLELSGRVPLAGEEWLDRAFLALACRDDAAFFASLDKAASGDLAALQGSIDSALAFQRGLDRVPPRGFVRFDGRWLTWEERANAELEREAAAAIAAALAPRGDAAKARETLVEVATAAPAIVRAQLARERDRLATAFAAAPEHAKLEAMRERATALRQARKEALALIMDEAKYFYPYSPPECPPEKAATYHEVQQEVDRRVGEVRALWGREGDDPPEPRIALSPAFLEVVRALGVARSLAATLGTPRDATDESLRLAWTLPPGAREVHVRSFALDENERARLDQDVKVMLLNASLAPAESGPTREELDQVLVTNRYRAMMGRRALAWNAKLWRAAHDHSEWMSRVGRLTHFQDDPERATPEQRMKLAGYDQGAGENCAAGRRSASDALDAWRHSSGHHRNLLYESHTELGSGQAGAYWTQCFGGGREYKGNLLRE